MLRPFFRPLVPGDSKDLLDANSWEFGMSRELSTHHHVVFIFGVIDISSPEFPGIHPRDGGYAGPKPTPALHPHLQLDDTMTSVPRVSPGDAVFWHCDVVHSVEREHTGSGDSAGMLILSDGVYDYAAEMLFTSYVHSCRPSHSHESRIRGEAEGGFPPW